ncbi:Chitosanase-domain-containing protein [Aspergillus cavernicola]|uniref:Endo-chitosanase n=1 Tax=Aspergillus cavernicola TaxID=176166 RepID=A0ABR4IJK0_9EURO
MAIKRILYQLCVLAPCTSALSEVIDGSHYNKANGGPPASYFTATATIPIAALQSAAAHLSEVPDHATYPIAQGASKESTIYSDWASFSKGQGAAIVWTADMDVNCDGIDYKCDGNSDGLHETNWGALAAYAVPFIVIPDKYLSANEHTIPGNNVAAVICDGHMFYGILGDSNGDSPQVTGEASWLMARTCFPEEDLRGDIGHSDADVTYILFLGNDAVLPNSATGQNYISDFGTLKSMGDRLVNALISNIGLRVSSLTGSSASETLTHSHSTPTSTATHSSTSTPISSCSWAGHCEGATCSTSDDCANNPVCSDGICSSDQECSPASLYSPCSTNNDCSNDLTCSDGLCAADGDRHEDGNGDENDGVSPCAGIGH